MKTYIRYTLLCLFALSSALCGAGVTAERQNFQSLSTSKKIKFNSPTNTIGTTDFVTYKCSGGAAKFTQYNRSPNPICIFLNNSGALVTTSRVENLDSLCIEYYDATVYPNVKVDFKVEISTDSIDFTLLTVVSNTIGLATVKMPQAGDYYVRISMLSKNFYIPAIEYYCLDLSGCPNCFLYKPE